MKKIIISSNEDLFKVLTELKATLNLSREDSFKYDQFIACLNLKQVNERNFKLSEVLNNLVKIGISVEHANQIIKFILEFLLSNSS